MRSPEKYLQMLLGDLRHVEIQGRQYDLYEEVSLPASEDMEALLVDQPVRYAAWRRIASACRRDVSEAHDALEEIKSLRFIHYWNHLEEKERAEMAHSVHDEDAVKDEFNRRVTTRRRVRSGVPLSVGRWRRNFSDDYVWGYVRNDDDVAKARTAHRVAKEQLDLAETVVEALGHRARCLSHLCAIHRDNLK